MSQLDWTTENLVAHLGKVFLRHVLDNFRGRLDATVQFGTTGTGVRPNYQVTYLRPDGSETTIAFRGSTHSAYGKHEQFVESHISPRFSYADVERAYRQ